jgi:hypothetical protein
MTTIHRPIRSAPPAPVRLERRPLAAAALAATLFVEALTAIPSGILMIARPDGSAFGATPQALAGTPFDSWLVPGVLLFSCLGLLPLAAAVLVWRGRSHRWAAPVERLTGYRLGWAVAGASAVAIMVWIVTQVLMLGAVAALHVIYFTWGGAIGLLTITPSVREWLALDPP